MGKGIVREYSACAEGRSATPGHSGTWRISLAASDDASDDVSRSLGAGCLVANPENLCFIFKISVQYILIIFFPLPNSSPVTVHPVKFMSFLLSLKKKTQTKKARAALPSAPPQVFVPTSLLLCWDFVGLEHVQVLCILSQSLNSHVHQPCCGLESAASLESSTSSGFCNLPCLFSIDPTFED